VGVRRLFGGCLKVWQAGRAAAGQLGAGTLVEGIEEGCRARHRDTPGLLEIWKSGWWCG
jgi:hypothetical protein